MNLRQLVEDVQAIRSLPEVEVRIWGGQLAQQILLSLTAPHPKFRLIQSKRWGVALLRLPPTFEEYLASAERSYLRRKRRQAAAQGLYFSTVAPMTQLDQILSINASKEVRQGRAMSPDYLDGERLKAYFQERHLVYGVFDQGAVLRAYASVVALGEVCSFDRLLGHADALECGVMYLLVSEVIRELTEQRAWQGAPIWVMYDTFFGAHPGLRYFKERVGFRPYKVRWVWQREAQALPVGD